MVSWPDAVPPRREDGSPGPELDALIRGPGTALAGVLLVSDAPAPDAARETAIDIARAWARTGRRIVLVDLGLEQPSLHASLGVRNDEGIGDHFEFGTSLDRLALPVDNAEWALVPAGAYTPDPAAVVGDPGWGALLQAAAEQDATLLLFAPADTPRLAELAAVVGAVLDLGGARRLDGLRGYSVLAALEPGAVGAAVAEATSAPEATPVPEAVLSPEATPVPEGSSSERLSEEEYERIRLPKDVRSREALIADLRARQRDALMQPPAGTGARGEALEAGERGAGEPTASPVRPAELAGALSPEAAALIVDPAPLRREPPIGEPPPRRVAAAPRRRRNPLLLTLVIVALVSLLAAGWHFASGWVETRRAAREAAAAAAEPVREPVPIDPLPVIDTVLGYAVALEAHPQLPDALQRVGSLLEAMPEAGFFIAPLVREGSLYYHVMAGPVLDSATAGALMDTLIARRHKTGSTPADLRHAPLAFLVGEYATADSAAARIAELAELDVPGYALPLGGPPARVRVYVGGYAGSAEAEVMGEMLRAVGVRDTLVAREGRR